MRRTLSHSVATMVASWARESQQTGKRLKSVRVHASEHMLSEEYNPLIHQGIPRKRPVWRVHAAVSCVEHTTVEVEA